MATYTANRSLAENHNQHWSITVDKAGIYELQTENKFIDENVDITIPKGETKVGSIVKTEDATVPAGSSIIIESGFHNDEIVITVADASEGTPGAVSASASLDGSSINGGEFEIGEKNGNSYPISKTVSLNTVGENKATISVDTPGYISSTVGTKTEGDITGDVTITGSLKAGILSHTATEGIDYAEDNSNATIIPAEGSLYLEEGYYPATQITLAHLIPDSETLAKPGVADIRSGYVAYDSDGKEVIGTMEDANISVAGGTYTYTSETKPSLISDPGMIEAPFSEAYGDGVITGSKIEITNVIKNDATSTSTKAIIPLTIKSKELSVSAGDTTYTKAGYISSTDGTLSVENSTVPAEDTYLYAYIDRYTGVYTVTTEA